MMTPFFAPFLANFCQLCCLLACSAALTCWVSAFFSFFLRLRSFSFSSSVGSPALRFWSSGLTSSAWTSSVES